MQLVGRRTKKQSSGPTEPDDQSRTLKFQELFQGNPNAYGSDTGSAIWSPVSTETFHNHLLGLEPIGIYPIVHTPTNMLQVRWGCCDIDTGDWSEAFMLATALRGMGLKPHVERSRSKGWHIWVFVDDPVSAMEMRRCLKVAYAAIDLPAKEANPKQENLGANQLGNYVRLPYKAGLLLDPERQTMMVAWSKHHDGWPISFRDWIDGEYQVDWGGGWEDARVRFDHYSDSDVVRKWAVKWFEPPRASTQTVLRDIDPNIGDMVLSTWRATWNGADGWIRDRSAAFVAMAHAHADWGYQPQQVFDILWACPWNKYVDRPDGEKYVQDIVDRAFT